jgi:hypothetical protein
MVFPVLMVTDPLLPILVDPVASARFPLEPTTPEFIDFIIKDPLDDNLDAPL